MVSILREKPSTSTFLAERAVLRVSKFYKSFRTTDIALIRAVKTSNIFVNTLIVISLNA